MAFGKTVDFELPPQFDVDFEVDFKLPVDGMSAPRAFAKWKSSETANFGPPLLCFEFLFNLSLECDGDEDGACFGDEACGFCETALGAFCNFEELLPVCILFPLSAAQPAREPPVTPLPEVAGRDVFISCRLNGLTKAVLDSEESIRSVTWFECMACEDFEFICFATFFMLFWHHEQYQTQRGSLVS